MMSVANAILNATQTYEDPEADALFRTLVDSGLSAERAHKALETVMPTKTGRSFNPARKPGMPAHGQGPAQTTAAPDGDTDLRGLARDLIQQRDKRSDFDRALAGSAVSPTRTQQSFNSARNITGEAIPATPVNGQAAVDKYLRMGGGMPTAAQLVAAGRLSEGDVKNETALAAARLKLKQERDDKYTAIKAREAGKRRSTETAIFE